MKSIVINSKNGDGIKVSSINISNIEILVGVMLDATMVVIKESIVEHTLDNHRCEWIPVGNRIIKSLMELDKELEKYEKELGENKK